MTDTMHTYVYGLLCPIANQIRYVGYSEQVVKRYKQHIKGATYKTKKPPKPKDVWIKELAEQGMVPTLVILQEIEWTKRERDGRKYWYSPVDKNIEAIWVKRLRDEGHDLLNHELDPAADKNGEAQILLEAIDRGREMFG